MTETTPDAPPLDPEEPDPTPEPPAPVEEEPPADEEPGEEAPPVPSSDPCPAVYPHDPTVVCQLFANHFDFRLVHQAEANGTTYEWE